MQVNLKIKEEDKDKFILEDDNKNLISWPKNKLPKDLKIGDNVKFYINQAPAKEILNEILKI
jgi:hypothetical protein